MALFSPGDSKARLDLTDTDSRECYSIVAWVERRSYQSSNRFRKDCVVFNSNCSENFEFEGIRQGTENISFDIGTEQGALPSNTQSHWRLNYKVQQNHPMRWPVGKGRPSSTEASALPETWYRSVNTSSHPDAPEPEEHCFKGKLGNVGSRRGGSDVLVWFWKWLEGRSGAFASDLPGKKKLEMDSRSLQ